MGLGGLLKVLWIYRELLIRYSRGHGSEPIFGIGLRVILQVIGEELGGIFAVPILIAVEIIVEAQEIVGIGM